MLWLAPSHSHRQEQLHILAHSLYLLRKSKCLRALSEAGVLDGRSRSSRSAIVLGLGGWDWLRVSTPGSLLR